MDTTPGRATEATEGPVGHDEHPDYRTLPEASPPQAWTESQPGDPGEAGADPFSFSAEHVVDAWTIGG